MKNPTFSSSKFIEAVLANFVDKVFVTFVDTLIRNIYNFISYIIAELSKTFLNT